MNKTLRVMFILACIFVTFASVFLFLEAVVMFWAINILFFENGDLGDAIGGVLLFIYGVGAAILTGISCLAALPFDIVLLKKEGKKWYSLAILIFIIVAIVLAILMAISLPILGNINNARQASSSSSSSSI